MTRRVRRTAQAAQDILDIYTYIGLRSLPAAEKVLESIKRQLNALLEVPGVGRRWHSFDPRLDGMRIAVLHPYRSHLIFFRDTPAGIEVLRVVHGARDLASLIEEIDLSFEPD